MRNLYLIKIWLIISIFSCKSVQISDLRTNQKNIKLLPALEVFIDVYSLESAYSLGKHITQGSSSQVGGMKDNLFISIGSFSSESFSKFDKRVQETITLLDREVKDNITNPIGKLKGHVNFSIATSDTRSTKVLLVIPSVLSFFTINLLGSPVFYFKTELEILAEIKDLEGNIVGRYQGYGKSEVPVALYYGYKGGFTNNSNTTDHNAARITNINAIKMALNEIKQKINQDADSIIIRLN